MNAYDKALNEIKASCVDKKGNIDYVKLAGKLDVMLFDISLNIPASGEIFQRYEAKATQEKK